MKTHLILLAVFGLCSAAVAQEPTVDPKIKARLLDQLRAQLAASGVPSASGPVTTHSDGSESMRLGADQVSVVVATVNAEGELETQCVRSASAAAEILATDQSPALSKP